MLRSAVKPQGVSSRVARTIFSRPPKRRDGAGRPSLPEICSLSLRHVELREQTPFPQADPDRRGDRRRGRRTQCRCRQGWVVRPERSLMPVTVSQTDEGVAVLTFSAPPVNLYSLELHADFDRALGEVEQMSPRALLIRAEGKIVSGG